MREMTGIKGLRLLLSRFCVSMSWGKPAKAVPCLLVACFGIEERGYESKWFTLTSKPPSVASFSLLALGNTFFLEIQQQFRPSRPQKLTSFESSIGVPRYLWTLLNENGFANNINSMADSYDHNLVHA